MYKYIIIKSGTFVCIRLTDIEDFGRSAVSKSAACSSLDIFCLIYSLLPDWGRGGLVGT